MSSSIPIGLIGKVQDRKQAFIDEMGGIKEDTTSDIFIKKEPKPDQKLSPDSGIKLTFKTTRDITKDQIGSFMYPKFVKDVMNRADVMNYINICLSNYATMRGYYPPGREMWFDFIVPDQLQDLLGTKWISITGNGSMTMISKLSIPD